MRLTMSFFRKVPQARVRHALARAADYIPNGDAAAEKKKQWSEVVQRVVVGHRSGNVQAVNIIYSLTQEEEAEVQQLIDARKAEVGRTCRRMQPRIRQPAIRARRQLWPDKRGRAGRAARTPTTAAKTTVESAKTTAGMAPPPAPSRFCRHQDPRPVRRR